MEKKENVESLIEESLNIAEEFLKKEQYLEVNIILNQILKVDDENLRAMQLLGLSKYGQGKYQESKLICENLIKLEPNNSENFNNLSLCYSSLLEWELAVYYIKQAIALDEKSIYHSNLGLLYRQKEDYTNAKKHFDRAIEIDINNHYAWANLGSLYGKIKDIQKCISCLETASHFSPENKSILVNLAYAHLLNGDFQKGWKAYENRLDSFKQLEHFNKIYDKTKRWQGENIHDKNIVIYGEQGIGDMIQFSRFIPMLKERGCNILLHTSKSLIPLFEANKLSLGISEVGTLFSQYDYFCSIMSLPYLLKINEIKYYPAYLQSPCANFDNYKDYFKIGITWAGNPQHPNDFHRSCKLSYFKQLQIPGVKFFSLQKESSKRKYTYCKEPIDLTEDCEDMSIVDTSVYMEDFYKTSMIINALDLVISVDTAILHLSGALGKKTWGLIPYNPDWRWGLEGCDTPWYPSVSLFRQSSPGGWDELFEKVKNQLLCI